MSYRTRAAVIFLCIFISFAAIAKHVDKNTPPEPGPAPLADYGESTAFTLPNGLRVIVVENHKLPSISCDLQFAIKPALEQERAGYRLMMGDLLQYGTKKRNKSQLAYEIDQLGADIVTTDQEIAARGLARDRDKLLDIISDIAINTFFMPDDVEQLKTRSISQVLSRQNDADVMLGNVSAALNYGASHPFGSIITDQTLARVKPEDCQKYYSTYFRPNVAYLAIVGDVRTDDIKQLVEKYFSTWRSAEVPVAEYGHYDAPLSPHVSFVPRKSSIQSIIRITYPIDLVPGTENTIKARVANMMLGGNSQSLLFRDLRVNHQLAYTTYSSILENEFQGSFTANARCKLGADDSVVNTMINDMRRMSADVDNALLEKAKWAVVGNFATSLTDPANVATYAINLERFHMPKDYYRNYLKSVSSITLDDIKIVSAKYINPDNINIIVAGNIKDAAKFNKYSPNNIDFFDNHAEIIRFPYDTVKPLPLPEVSTHDTLYSNSTIALADTYKPKNDPKTTEQPVAMFNPAADPGMSDIPAGAATSDIIKKYILAIGGERAIANIKSVKKVSSGSITAGPSSLELTVTEIRKIPNKMKLMVEGLGTVIQKQVLNGDKGYSEMQGQKRPLTATDVDNMQAEADLQKILHPEKYGITRTLKGMGNVNGAEAFVINAIDRKGKLVVEYYDLNTGYLVKKEEADPGAGGATKVTEYSDYRDVPGGNGFKMPYKTRETENKHSATSRIKVVEINKPIPDTVFN